MGVKYTSQSSSGYDSGSPPDDGTTGEDNKCKWSVIKSSLTDVLETFSDAINAQLVAYFDFGTNAISGTYTTLTSDNGKVLEITGSPDVTLGAAATMGAGYVVTFKTVSGTTTAKTGGADEIDGSTADRAITAGNSETYRVNAAADAYLLESSNTNEVITTRGDIIRGDSSGLPERLAIGTSGQVLTSDGTDAAWAGTGIWVYLDTFDTLSGATLGTNTSIPAGTVGIKCLFNGISGSGSGSVDIEIGSSGPTYSVSSNGNVTVDAGTIGAVTNGPAKVTTTTASDTTLFGMIELMKFNGSDVFAYSGQLADTANAEQYQSAGIVTLVGALTAIKVTFASGTFDAGSVDVYTWS